MIVQTLHFGAATVEISDDAYAGIRPEEIKRRQAVFDRTLRETVRQIQREQAARQTRTE